MKNIEEVLLGRTSVRRYERRAIEPEKLDFIYKAIQNTSTSYNGQQFSVVAVTDQAIKEQLYEIIGQKQVKTSAVFLFFCIDFHQLELAGNAKGIEFPNEQDTLNGFAVGVVDASLAMANAMTAAMSLGLGCCAIGYARTADPERTSQILGLPPKTGIICGLSIGYPNEHPDIKPKRPLSLVIHENRYGDDEKMSAELLEYDKVVSKYNLERAGDTTSNDWITHILNYHQVERQKNIATYFRNRGFLRMKE